MDYDLIRIEMEAALSRELYDLFEGKIVKQIIREGKVTSERNPYKHLLEGHSFKITPRLAPRLYALCYEVKERLEFDEDVDFFIRNSPEINCFAVSKMEEGQNHLVMLNSTLIEKFDEEELRFVIGHEIGHLISKNVDLYKIINFVFPEIQSAPIVFQNKINLWNKLSELTADRYGFIASPNIEKCVSNFFKLASGLDTLKIAFDSQAYLSEMDEVLNYFKKEPFAITTSHPINPVRLKAIQLFHESKLFEQIQHGKKLRTDKNLNHELEQLIKILMVLGDSELDTYRSYFIATGGLIIAQVDEKVTREEMDEIVNLLAQFTIFPARFLDAIVESGKLEELFQNSTEAIISESPGERGPMFEFLVGIALSDNEIIKPEIDLLYKIGESLFGFTHKEVAQIIGQAIQNRFSPKLYL